MTALATGCLVLAAVTVLWPAPGPRRRRRRLVPSRPAHARPRRWAGWRDLVPSPRSGLGVAPAVVGVLATVGAALWAGGVVAGVVTAAYGTLTARLLRARVAGQERSRRRAAVLDTLSGAAADLRAGLPAGRALSDLTVATDQPSTADRDQLRERVGAVSRLAERTGAPLADLLERIEADARAGDRARTALAGQAAGSQATAYLLAALPAAGIGLGYAIGADPLTVLLATPIGGACAVGAVALQLAGLAWTRRITRPGVGL